MAGVAPLGPDQGEIALSLVALLYKAASSATPAVRMVPGRLARILGVICSIFPQQLKGSTNVPLGFHMLLGISPELIVELVALHRVHAAIHLLYFLLICTKRVRRKIHIHGGSHCSGQLLHVY